MITITKRKLSLKFQKKLKENCDGVMRKINPDLNSRDRIGSDTSVLVLLGEGLEEYIRN